MTDDRTLVLGALRFTVPADWTAQQQVMLQLPHTSMDGIDFRPHLVLQRQLLAPLALSVDIIADERMQLLATHLPQFEPELVQACTLQGRRAVRMSYRWHNGADPLRQRMVLCVLDGWLYEMTFSDVVQRFDQSVDTFDHWLSALGDGECAGAGCAGAGRTASEEPARTGLALDINALFGRR